MANKQKLSYACAPVGFPYIYQTIPDRLRQLASADPDREAFVYYDINQKRSSVTRKQLLDQSTHAAKILTEFGLKKGSTVAICMTNSLELLIFNMGVLLAGGVPLFLSTNLKDGRDLVEFINNLEVEFLLLDTTGDDENWKILENIWPNGLGRSTKVPSLKIVVCNGKNSIKETKSRKLLSSFISRKTNDSTILPVTQPEETATYYCTSGSTGRPKVVMHSHYNILNYTKSGNISLGIKENSIVFCERTFSWALGSPRFYPTEGATRVFIDQRMSLAGSHTDAICDIIEGENCDIVYLPEYMVVDVLKKPHLCIKLKHVQTICTGGERVKKYNLDRLREGFCSRIMIICGFTECGGVSNFSADSDTGIEDGLIGKPEQGVEMKVVDEKGDVVPVGTKGELHVRCTWRFTGYSGLDDKFREVVDIQDWFHTGDIARLREDGNFVIEGRTKEMISTGSNKYFPWVIEAALKNMQGAEQVFAVGVPEPRLKQVVCACVVPIPGVSLTEENVRTFCNETFLEESTSMGVSLKPRHFIILDNVPRTSTGKVDRQTIAIQAAEKLGLQTNIN